MCNQARVQGGGYKGRPPPPPRNGKAKKGHQSKSCAISPIFCYFFSRKYHFLCYFLSCPPLEKLKSKRKKSLSDFRPPSYEFLDTPLAIVNVIYILYTYTIFVNLYIFFVRRGSLNNLFSGLHVI